MIALKVLDRCFATLDVMLQQSDVVEVILLWQELVILIDLERVAGKALEKIVAIAGVDNLLKAFRLMVQWRPRLVYIPYFIKT